MGAAGYPVKVWIDSSGLVRQLQFAISAYPNAAASSAGASAAPPASGNAPAASMAIAVTVTLQFYDYGTPVSVSAPPSDQTVDLTNQLASSSPSG